MADDPQYEDQIMRRVLAICLRDEDTDAAANPPVIRLQGLAEVRKAATSRPRSADCSQTNDLPSENGCRS